MAESNPVLPTKKKLPNWVPGLAAVLVLLLVGFFAYFPSQQKPADTENTPVVDTTATSTAPSPTGYIDTYNNKTFWNEIFPYRISNPQQYWKGASEDLPDDTTGPIYYHEEKVNKSFDIKTGEMVEVKEPLAMAEKFIGLPPTEQSDEFSSHIYSGPVSNDKSQVILVWIKSAKPDIPEGYIGDGGPRATDLAVDVREFTCSTKSLQCQRSEILTKALKKLPNTWYAWDSTSKTLFGYSAPGFYGADDPAFYDIASDTVSKVALIKTTEDFPVSPDHIFPSPSLKSVAYVIEGRDGAINQLAIFDKEDPTKPSHIIPLEKAMSGSNLAWSADEKQIALNAESSIWLVNIEKGTAEKLYEISPQEIEVPSYDLVTGTYSTEKTTSPTLWAHRNIAFSPNGAYVIFPEDYATANESGIHTGSTKYEGHVGTNIIKAVHIATRRVLNVASIPGEIIVGGLAADNTWAYPHGLLDAAPSVSAVQPQ